MPRPPLQIGTWGKIRRQRTSPGHWRARARFRDFDGTTRDVEATGATGAAAERALVEKMSQRAQVHASRSNMVKPTTTVAELGDLWLAEITSENRLTTSTVERYARVITNAIVPAMGQVRVGEASVSIIDSCLRTLVLQGLTASPHQAKIVLTKMFSMAVRHGAIPMNPVRETSHLPTPEISKLSIPLEAIDEIRAAAAAWDAQVRPGPAVEPFMADLVDVFLGTGARIGEALALRWEADIDLPVITICGTVVETSGGVVRQDWPKTHSSFRRLTLPDFTAEALARRRERLGVTSGPVFASALGSWRSPNNVRRSWRQVRQGTAFEWVKPHTFRKTVATIIDTELDTKHAAAQMGHASQRTTKRHYVNKPPLAPDATSALALLGPSAVL